MARIGIVVDSTCDIAPAELAQMDVELVPLKVLFNDESYLDGIDLTPAEFYEKMMAIDYLPKTSQPSPMQFLDAYKKCADAGCESIVSLSLSEELSGTFQSETMAALDSPIPVHVVDTRKVSLGYGLIVRELVEKRAAGTMNGEELAAYTQKLVDSSEMYFILDTLRNLVMGGRAGKAAGLAASLLNIKPILEVTREGVIVPVKKCKGRHKAIAELAQMIAHKSHKGGPIRYGVIYSSNISVANEMSNALDTAGVDGKRMGFGVVGPVVGVHAGLEATGVVFYRVPAE